MYCGGTTIAPHSPPATISSSIAAALHTVDSRCDVLVLVLGDQPGVTAEAVEKLADDPARRRRLGERGRERVEGELGWHVQAQKLKAVYELLESATDKCQDVANVIEGVVLEHG